MNMQEFVDECKDKKKRAAIIDDMAEWTKNKDKPGEIEFEQAEVWQESVYEHLFEERVPFVSAADFHDQTSYKTDEPGLLLTDAIVRNRRFEEERGIFLEEDNDVEPAPLNSEPATPSHSTPASASNRSSKHSSKGTLVSRTGTRLVIKTPLLKNKSHLYKKQAQAYFDKKAKELGTTLGVGWGNRYKPANPKMKVHNRKSIAEAIQKIKSKATGVHTASTALVAGLRGMTQAALADPSHQRRQMNPGPPRVHTPPRSVPAVQGGHPQKDRLAICDDGDADNASTCAPDSVASASKRTSSSVSGFAKADVDRQEPDAEQSDIEPEAELAGQEGVDGMEDIELHGSASAEHGDEEIDDFNDGEYDERKIGKTKTIGDWMGTLLTDNVWRGWAYSTHSMLALI